MNDQRLEQLRRKLQVFSALMSLIALLSVSYGVMTQGWQFIPQMLDAATGDFSEEAKPR